MDITAGTWSGRSHAGGTWESGAPPTSRHRSSSTAPAHRGGPPAEGLRDDGGSNESNG